MIKSFEWENKDNPVKFIETSSVKTGVECDVYSFVDDSEKDLGIVDIAPASCTPLQLIVKGDKTIEGYLSGRGKLVVISAEGDATTYEMDSNTETNWNIVVKVGEKMQWFSAETHPLKVFEICYPPYQEGRFKNYS